jgi:AraC-like DNA-binding protein
MSHFGTAGVPDWDIFCSAAQNSSGRFQPEIVYYRYFQACPSYLAGFLLGCWCRKHGRWLQKKGEVVKNKNMTDEVFRYILQVPEEDFAHLTIKMLAKHFEVSRCHISRTFRIERKMTLATFIHRQRLLRAERQLLRDQDLTVKALATSLGYADYQYFIARFKEHWGESPGRYRKMVGDSLVE